jgi:quercetin dioxygenase-like cupin family protein
MRSLLITRRGTNASLDVFGPTIEFLTLPERGDSGYCAMIGTIPAGVAVPLHSHPDLESFFLISGGIQALSEGREKLEWLDVNPGEFVHVPSNAKHAWRNTSRESAVMLITTTPKLGRFFQEVGRPVSPGASLPPPTPDDLLHFASVSAKYDYWVSSRAENAAVGINLFV